ncbi:NAD(P)H-flavin reductase [Glaciecola petra]|uniref:NAD(P)H-flavin reductase n=1 Tax=Glaciecola petra TaxID=3075602 RepID=A0ABU2ZRT7_9ALTE|nr:NAD(P)H-flavin reductase [Aestuariibacter sp. P117]MDT0595348.1 NAD(P)H-flavin reductase [Aestuariibacter sp. P117]
MTSIDVKVISIESLTETVTKIILETNQQSSFKAGQYLQVVMGENDKRPFSIANAPNVKGIIELHIGATPDNPYAYEVLQLASNTKKLKVEIGLGEAYVRESDKTMVIIAGGTGYSYAKSILLDTLANQTKRQINLYWGAKTQADLYELAELNALAKTQANFSFHPVVEIANTDWQGHVGLVHHAVLSDFNDLSLIDLYVAGRFEMAAVIKEVFTAKGLPLTSLYGDAFTYL